MNICKCCGIELKHDFSFKLRTLMHVQSQWGKLEEKGRTTVRLVNIFIKETGGSREEVQEYVDHQMGHKCAEKIRNCPKCDKRLRSWRAKMCLECGATFTRLMSHK